MKNIFQMLIEVEIVPGTTNLDIMEDLKLLLKLILIYLFTSVIYIIFTLDRSPVVWAQHKVLFSKA